MQIRRPLLLRPILYSSLGYANLAILHTGAGGAGGWGRAMGGVLWLWTYPPLFASNFLYFCVSLSLFFFSCVCAVFRTIRGLTLRKGVLMKMNCSFDAVLPMRLDATSRLLQVNQQVNQWLVRDLLFEARRADHEQGRKEKILTNTVLI